MQSIFQRRKKNSNSSTRSSSCGDDSSSVTTRNSVERNSKLKKTTFRVKIPPNIRPGEMFHVYAGDRLLKIKCPAGATPGRSIAISVPKEDKTKQSSKRNLHSPNVDPIPDTDPPAFNVTIPPHVSL